MDKKNKFSVLAKKAAMIFSASFAALTASKAITDGAQQVTSDNNNRIQFTQARKSKPMPVLKLNSNNIDDGKFIAQHRSHSSHSSHSSHGSHSSHRSHYSSSSFA